MEGGKEREEGRDREVWGRQKERERGWRVRERLNASTHLSTQFLRKAGLISISFHQQGRVKH